MKISQYVDLIDGFYAYDQGATDSGIKNDATKEQMKEKLKEFSGENFYILDRFINRYSGLDVEDIQSALEWLKEEMKVNWF